ncbi:Transposon TX1 uncharacterized 149 kDa protein [Vitis vinifera]|uniref:Transposon TX1 uncharacterized 149 kDa protein n=1 Tax=Vitis vinifera TaxID=29760 RepID=A0A438I9U6_VITVI|nr:Transposon TX1 uncharacterized 149 kDa protein [Vitis vinifera]
MGQESGGKQNRSWKGPTHRASHAAKGKAKVGYDDSELQRREPTVMRGSKKLWNVLLPSSSESRQGDRSREKPVTAKRSPTGSDSLSVEEGAEVGSILFQGGSEEGMTPTEEIEEQRNTLRWFFSRGSSFLSREQRKRAYLWGDYGLTKVGTFQVSVHLSPQPSLPLRYPFSGVAPPHQSPFEPDSSISAFHSQFPMKNRVLTENCLKKETMGIIVLARLMGPYYGSSKQGSLRFLPDEWIPYRRTKRRVVKDFLRLQNPDVVMFQETKREVCDRRFVGSVWSVRNKEWAILPACGASGGILIIWDSKKMRVYGPNNPSIRKEFWVELSDLFGLLIHHGALEETSMSYRCARDWIDFSIQMSGSFPSLKAFKKFFLDGHQITSRLSWILIRSSGDNTFSSKSYKKKGVRGANFKGRNSLETKAKIKWVKERDCNSKLFHKVANGRRNKNFIKLLENERGLVLDSSESITEEILLYFKKLYSCPPRESWRVEDRDKAPGPDGFTIAVFQDCWDVIKEDLVRVFAEFHNSGIINQNTNASFIVLLPKKSQSKKISDFRPISLITCLYKIIAKVLSGRLRGVLQETIHSTQGAFVQGRQILDAVLIANEIVDEKKRSGEEGVVFKIDFEKAYDHVKWDFLDHVLKKKGFSPRWRSWMRGCLSSVSYAILVNGNAKGWVKAARGLRQGDPLSPFLFTIVADVLSRMLLKAEERNFLEGFRVNLDKSNLFGINLDQNHLSRLALLLDCKASDWPILYLDSNFSGCKNREVTKGLSMVRVGEGKRDHLVRWEAVCKPRIIGGSGIGKIPLRNRALLGKWLWSQMLTPLSLEGHSTRLSGFFQVYSVYRRRWGKNSLLGRLWFVHSQIFLYSPVQMPDSSPFFPTKFVWKSQVPFKVKAFIWLVAHKKVNTNDLLQLRRPHKAISPDISSQDGLGSSEKHFRHDVHQLQRIWQVQERGNSMAKREYSVNLVVWRERNARIFEDKARNAGNLWDSIHFLASLWAFCSAGFKGTPLTYYNLIGYQCVVQIVPLGRSSALLFFLVV